MAAGEQTAVDGHSSTQTLSHNQAITEPRRETHLGDEMLDGLPQALRGKKARKRKQWSDENMIIDAITLNAQGLNLVICSASLFLEMNDKKEEESRIKGTIRPKLAVQPVRRCGWFLIQVTAPEFHRWTGAVYGVYDGCDPNQPDEIDFFLASQMSIRGCSSGSADPSLPPSGKLHF